MTPIYYAAKEHLGEHLSLNPSIPAEVGCCEAVSYILKASGYQLPTQGIAGVNALIAWMLQNGFTEQSYPSVGGIVTAHSPDADNVNFAHCGVILKYGIASNDSMNGLFLEDYTLATWKQYFTTENGSVTRYFSCA